MQREIAPRITVDRTVHHGRPVIAGTRTAVETVVGALAGGMTIQAAADEYDITEEDVRAALAYATQLVAAEEVLVSD